jgi:hypothetical protein
MSFSVAFHDEQHFPKHCRARVWDAVGVRELGGPVTKFNFGSGDAECLGDLVQHFVLMGGGVERPANYAKAKPSNR